MLILYFKKSYKKDLICHAAQGVGINLVHLIIPIMDF